MDTTAGDRLKALRQLMGLTQEEMAELFDISLSRYKNVEKKTVRMAEGEFSAACSRFPEFVHYLTYQGKIDIKALHESQDKLVRFAAAAIDAGKIPEGYFLEDSLE